MYLDLSSNYLRDAFALELAHTLKTNRILYEVDIASNQVWTLSIE